MLACVVVGVALFATAAIWETSYAPRWTQRLPPDWRWESEFVGIQTNADPTTGQLPAKDVTALYDRLIRISSEADRPTSVQLEDLYVIHDPVTGERIWEYVSRADVDPRTGAHLAPEYAGDYFVFPRHVEPRTYRLRFSYIKGVPVVFEREDEIEGLGTYVFSYRGPAEYTDAYVGNLGMPGLSIRPGQEVRCADDQYVLRVWVEPLTGETVKIQESCYSNDYLVEVATGKRLAVVDRWGGESAGDDVIRRAGLIRRSRLRYLLVSRWVPDALDAAGAFVVLLPLVRIRQLRRRAEPVPA
jgi:hypothetical protein